jgi:hypothetical protein
MVKHQIINFFALQWRDMQTRGWRQALRIATQLPHMTVRLASFAYNVRYPLSYEFRCSSLVLLTISYILIQEYILELREDASLKDLDLVYFEIWRLVIKDNVSILLQHKFCVITTVVVHL